MGAAAEGGGLLEAGLPLMQGGWRCPAPASLSLRPTRHVLAAGGDVGGSDLGVSPLLALQQQQQQYLGAWPVLGQQQQQQYSAMLAAQADALQQQGECCHASVRELPPLWSEPPSGGTGMGVGYHLGLTGGPLPISLLQQQQQQQFQAMLAAQRTLHQAQQLAAMQQMLSSGSSPTTHHPQLPPDSTQLPLSQSPPPGPQQGGDPLGPHGGFLAPQ